MFIQTEATPNPAILKFLPGRPVLAQGTLEFLEPEATKGSPLAARLFEIDGVTGVFLGSDFISVSKGEGEWQHLKPAILGAIMEHYQSGAPVAAEGEPGRRAPRKANFLSPPTPRPSTPSRSCSRRACAPPWPRMAATSPSRAIATASCSCICAAPVRVARARRRRSVTASRICSATSSPKCRKSARCDRGRSRKKQARYRTAKAATKSRASSNPCR